MAVTVDPRKTGLPYPAHLGTYTWATKPTASDYAAGTTIRASDVGISPGMLLVSDGTRWIPDGMQVLARSNAAAALTGTVNETALATITVPAGLLGVSGSLFVAATQTYTNSASSKTIRLRFSGISGTAYYSNAFTTTAANYFERTIANRTASSQVSNYSNATNQFVATAGTFITSAVDTSAETTAVISGQLASSGETITLENYQVWLLP